MTEQTRRVFTEVREKGTFSWLSVLPLEGFFFLFEQRILEQTCDVEAESHLQPIHGENIDGLKGDDIRPDIRARSVWRNG